MRKTFAARTSEASGQQSQSSYSLPQTYVISLILSEGKPCQNAEKNPSTEVILTIYDYNSATNSYHANGRTALLKAPGVLHVNVSNYIHHDNEKVTLTTDQLEELQSYIPFSNDVDIESRLANLSPTVISNPPPEKDEDECIQWNLYNADTIGAI